VERAGWKVAGNGPDALAVEVHLVLVPGAAPQTRAAHKRVVVSADVEGAVARPEDLDFAGRVGLDPDHRFGLSHVT
jgi:hypothetical protein